MNAMTDPEAALRETLSDELLSSIEQSALEASHYDRASYNLGWRGRDDSWFFKVWREKLIAAVAPLLTPRAWQHIETTTTFGPCWRCSGTGWVADPPSSGSTTAGGSTCQKCGGSGQIVTSITERSQPLPPAPKERAWQPPQITGPLQQIELSHLQARLTLAGVVQAARRWHPKGTVYSWPHEFDTALKAAETYLSTQPLPPATKERQG